jgi:hypothetical protein
MSADIRERMLPLIQKMTQAQQDTIKRLKAAANES